MEKGTSGREDVAYDDEYENITELVIKNQEGKVVYEKNERRTHVKKSDMKISFAQVNELIKQMTEKKVSLELILDSCQIKSIEDTTVNMYETVMRRLKKTVSKAA